MDLASRTQNANRSSFLGERIKHQTDSNLRTFGTPFRLPDSFTSD